MMVLSSNILDRPYKKCVCSLRELTSLRHSKIPGLLRGRAFRRHRSRLWYNPFPIIPRTMWGMLLVRNALILGLQGLPLVQGSVHVKGHIVV